MPKKFPGKMTICVENKSKKRSSDKKFKFEVEVPKKNFRERITPPSDENI